MSSGYRRALESKEKLLEIIEGKIVENTKKPEGGGCPFLGDFMARAGGDLELVKQHLLLFVCALIPKAMASTLAFFLHTSPAWIRQRRVDRCGQWALSHFVQGREFPSTKQQDIRRVRKAKKSTKGKSVTPTQSIMRPCTDAPMDEN